MSKGLGCVCVCVCVCGGGGGVASRVFFRGLRVRLMSKPSVILRLIGVLKQKLSFSTMIFYLRSTECFFHGLHDSLCNTIAVGPKINSGYLSVALLHNIFWYSMQCGHLLISLSVFN